VKRWFSSSIFVAVLLLNSCGRPEIQLAEVKSETASSTETIHMNNCGGKDSSEQIAQRAFAISLELNSQSQTDYNSIEGMVAGKYGLFKEITKSQILKAPAGTDMEFSLRWLEDIYMGDIFQGRNIGKYIIHVPVSVELVSSLDLGCITEDIGNDSNIRETLTVYFKDGATGVSTENQYSGYVTIIVLGAGRASAAQMSDAFYVFTDFDGKSIDPMRYDEFYNFTLWINGEPADTMIDSIPPFNPDHVYQFTINAPGGRLVFAVGDIYVDDNDGSYVIMILK